MLKKNSGFTLLELMIVIVIIAVMVSAALPTYFNQITRARRSNGKIALLDLAAKMERYYAENHTYVGATFANLESSSQSPDGYYHLAIKNKTATTFLLQAQPQGQQATRDTKCGTFQINQLNHKTITGSGTVGECW